MILFRIILHKPFSGVAHALQSGSGNNYAILQAQTANTNDLVFDGSFLVKGQAAADEWPDFSGPLVQGAKGARFIYIDIGTAARQIGSSWTRRLKIPLTGITWKMIREIQSTESSLLQTTVPGIGKDGGPNCATVKPFSGWQVLNRSK